MPVKLNLHRGSLGLMTITLGLLSACGSSEPSATGGVGGNQRQGGTAAGGSSNTTVGTSTKTSDNTPSGGNQDSQQGGALGNVGGASRASSLASSSGTGGVDSIGGQSFVGGRATASSVKAAGGNVAASGGPAVGGGSAKAGNSNGGGVGRGGAGNPGGAKNSGGAPASGGAHVAAGSGNVGRGGAAAAGSSAAGGSVAAAGNAFRASFYIGADITDQEVAPEAARASLLTLMKSRGFNYIRLRTFVDPKASDGYDKTNGYDDITHTVAFGKQIKDAGMGLLVDFHYSDNWADPGKQCVPVAWQSYTTITELATALHDYTQDSITKLIAGGARPDMVQIGNETTPGMLLHRCDGGGQPTGNNPVTGSTSNWANLGALLKAGVDAVKEVDPTILVSFHIDRGGDKPSDSSGAALQTSINWLTNAMKYVTPDAFGESCYQRYQGDPNSTANTKTGWANTFSGLAKKFPNILLFAAEYGPMQREINDVLFSLPNNQGIGTFNWEPTTQGDWNTGHDLIRRSGNNYTAQPDLALYDQMMIDYASRL